MSIPAGASGGARAARTEREGCFQGQVAFNCTILSSVNKRVTLWHEQQLKGQEAALHSLHGGVWKAVVVSGFSLV